MLYCGSAVISDAANHAGFSFFPLCLASLPQEEDWWARIWGLEAKVRSLRNRAVRNRGRISWDVRDLVVPALPGLNPRRSHEVLLHRDLWKSLALALQSFTVIKGKESERDRASSQEWAWHMFNKICCILHVHKGPKCRLRCRNGAGSGPCSQRVSAVDLKSVRHTSTYSFSKGLFRVAPACSLIPALKLVLSPKPSCIPTLPHTSFYATQRPTRLLVSSCQCQALLRRQGRTS